MWKAHLSVNSLLSVNDPLQWKHGSIEQYKNNQKKMNQLTIQKWGPRRNELARKRGSANDLRQWPSCRLWQKKNHHHHHHFQEPLVMGTFDPSTRKTLENLGRLDLRLYPLEWHTSVPWRGGEGSVMFVSWTRVGWSKWVLNQKEVENPKMDGENHGKPY